MADSPGSALVRRWIADAAAAHPGKPYVVSVDDDRSVGYGQLQRTTALIAGDLASRGIGIGDRVALLANNSIEHLLVYLGVLAAGATICTIHVEMNRGRHDALLPRLAPRLALFEEGLGLDAVAAGTGAPNLPLGRWRPSGGDGFFAARDGEGMPCSGDGAAANDDAVIFFTSGTEAAPKGVVLTFQELLRNADAVADAFGVGPDDRLYDCRSFNWASAQLLGALATLSRGATLLLGRKFSRSRFFDIVAKHRASIAAANPTMINMLSQGPEQWTGRDLPHLRFITSSSAPLLEQDWRRFEGRFAIPIVQGYGTSETGWIAAATHQMRPLGSAGRPLPYQRLAIVDGDGRPQPAGEIGAVEVGPFEGNPYRSVADDGSIRCDAIGRIRTGDLGYLDAAGFLWLTGRARDLIIRGGVNISPVEIDNLLLEIPDVVEAGTIGIPDRIYGEEVVSYVALRRDSPMTAEAIRAFCAARIPEFKTPKRIFVCNRLPKTGRGKLDRNALAHAPQFVALREPR